MVIICDASPVAWASQEIAKLVKVKNAAIVIYFGYFGIFDPDLLFAWSHPNLGYLGFPSMIFRAHVAYVANVLWNSPKQVTITSIHACSLRQPFQKAESTGDLSEGRRTDNSTRAYQG